MNLVYRSRLATSVLNVNRVLNSFSKWKIYKMNTAIYYSTKANKDSSEMPKNILEKYYNAHSQTELGNIYDKKPFKVHLVANKPYLWCTCGQSKNQPFCDGTHKSPYLKINLRPVRFAVEETKDYWLCNCKQTTSRPFCDGTHNRTDIQEKRL